MHPLSVRRAEVSDLESILAIYNHAIATTTAVFSYEPHTMAMRQEWLAARQAAGHPVLVGTLDDAVVGFASYGPFRPWPAYQYTVEHSVHVAERARRRGVARALMEALIAEARTQQYHVMVGGIAAENTASLHLHASLGFIEVAHFHEVGYKFGRWLDLKFVQLLL